MQVTPSTHQRRTFSRTNGADVPAVPSIVAARERYTKNMQNIQYLKQALCSTLSGATTPHISSASSRRCSLPSNTLPVPPLPGSSWIVPSSECPSNGGPSPPQGDWATLPASRRSSCPSVSAAALLESQQEVESLVRERNRLQRQCVEWANLFAQSPPHDVESTGRAAILDSHSVLETGAWASVHEAALAVMIQVKRHYPSVVRELQKGSDSVAREASVLQHAVSEGSPALHGSERGATYPDGCSTSHLTAAELVDMLHRLARCLPLLASNSGGAEVVSAPVSDLLREIHVLEEEKQSDGFAVLSIAEHLASVSSRLKQETVEKDKALRAMQETVETLMSEKSQWARRARVSEKALAERYEQYKHQERAWEKEVTGILQWKHGVEVASASPRVLPASIAGAMCEESGDVSAAATAMDVGQRYTPQLHQEHAARGAALAALQEEHSALQTAYAELQAHSQDSEATAHRRIAELESQLRPLEAELQTQARMIESMLRKVEELSLAHQTETAALVNSHNMILAERAVAYLALEEAKERVAVELEERATYAAQVRVGLENTLGTLAAAQGASDSPDSCSLARDGVSVERASKVGSVAATRLKALRDGDADDGDANCAKGQMYLDEVAAPGRSRRVSDDDEQDVTEPHMSSADVRRLQQSLKRVSRERTALQRKLEQRSSALAEIESELEVVQRLVAHRDAQVEALAYELETAKSTCKPLPRGEKEVNGHSAVGEGGATGALLPLIDFSELERHEDKGNTYPDPVDVSEWLLGHGEGSSMRFSTYVRSHLSESEQLRISAVGPLYHIGFTLLQVEKLVKAENAPFGLPRAWCRLLFQLQHVLDAQVRGTLVSPGDSAKCFYLLASKAGFFGDRCALERDPLTGYALVIAALSVCLRCPAASTSAQGSCWWRCCQKILLHVSQFRDGEAADSQAPDDLFVALCSECSAPPSVPDEDAEGRTGAVSDGAASVPPSSWIHLTALFASDIFGDHLPISHLALWAASLSHVLDNTVIPPEDQLLADPVTEAAPLSAAAGPCLGFFQKHDLTPLLLLYVARHEYLLLGWAYEMEKAVSEADDGIRQVHDQAVDAACPTLASLGISMAWPAPASAHPAFSRSVPVVGCAPSPTKVTSITQLLVFLSAGILPVLILVSHCCPALENEVQLLNAFFRTRGLLMARQAELLPKSLGEVSGPSELMSKVALLLPEAQLRDFILAVLHPAKGLTCSPQRVIPVPVEEYERLHRELLSLYETNDTYHQYIQDMLSAAEEADVSLGEGIGVCQ